MSAEDEKAISSWSEFFQSVRMEELADTSDIEAVEGQWKHIFNTNPEVQSAMLIHFWWYMTGNWQALQESGQALELYDKELKRWSAHKLMCLCVLIACDSFEFADPDMVTVTVGMLERADPNMSQMTAEIAEMLWEKALEIYQRIRQQASQPDTERRDISKANRTKVFKDLGIRLKFPNGLTKVKGSLIKYATDVSFGLLLLRS
jgi:hypothetical protein